MKAIITVEFTIDVPDDADLSDAHTELDGGHLSFIVPCDGNKRTEYVDAAGVVGFGTVSAEKEKT